jgi:predicted transposase YbfD/YdcC
MCIHLGCHALPKKTVELIKQQGNDALIQVKENQHKLLNDCMSTASVCKPASVYASATEKSHGRLEQRSAKVYDKVKWIEDEQWKKLIGSIGVVERHREVYDSELKQWKISDETAYYIYTSSITADELLHLSRKHWKIENTNHYVRDVSLLEDKSRNRNNPGIMARIKSFALNILRRNGERHIRQCLYKNSVNIENLMKFNI